MKTKMEKKQNKYVIVNVELNGIFKTTNKKIYKKILKTRVGFCLCSRIG